jgi:hypothetical protein
MTVILRQEDNVSEVTPPCMGGLRCWNGLGVAAPASEVEYATGSDTLTFPRAHHASVQGEVNPYVAAQRRDSAKFAAGLAATLAPHGVRGLRRGDGFGDEGESFISEALCEPFDGPTIVMTHHAPMMTHHAP